MGRSAQLGVHEDPPLSADQPPFRQRIAENRDDRRGDGRASPGNEAGRVVPRSSATSHELARIELLAGLPGETLAKLAKEMERQEVAPGSAIVREGEKGDRFYVVFAGMLSVANSAMGRRGVLRPGD